MKEGGRAVGQKGGREAAKEGEGMQGWTAILSWIIYRPRGGRGSNQVIVAVSGGGGARWLWTKGSKTMAM